MTTKVLGTANYIAVRSPGTDTVMLMAKGILPCMNYSAQLEMRPERPVPPMWSMVFFIEDFCLRTIKPFELSVLMNAGAAVELTVFDASGEVKVPIADPILPVDTHRALADILELYDIYALLPPAGVKLAKPTGCIIVPEGSLVPAIYYHVFGPAQRADCENWLNNNCGAKIGSTSKRPEKGSEVPWPIFKEI